MKTQLGQSMASMRQLLQKPIKVDEKGNFKLGTSQRSERKQARNESRQRLRQIRSDLFALLGQHPSSRRLMRHLAMVERTLQAEGIEGFEALPVRFIEKALGELERVVWDWSPSGLAELRSRMAVIVKNRPRPVLAAPGADTAPAALPAAADSDFSLNVKADVSEATHAEFEAMERSWAGFMPKPVPAAEEAVAA
ncbi:MAG TPA: hypothetical protein VGM74_20040 [Burkholderiaceae bacterium]